MRFLLIPKLYMGVTLKKNDLIAQVASSSGLSKSDAGKALDAVLDSIITSALASGDEVRIIGFGHFLYQTARLPPDATYVLAKLFKSQHPSSLSLKQAHHLKML